ncbi:sensor histidine kinase [Pseudonocardia humida]|uniref:histidine kinase n=1 Tax=Pseudonocardia humida TaxID=2800819 RepID=A0ABT1AC13_9PSEU|nr:HAMP domain-containing sensor histidine kinase [Pseudonocardia humida]MCO1660485.1 HAMP domain-containing histidine kinase [Pseudonocardia humida]
MRQLVTRLTLTAAVVAVAAVVAAALVVHLLQDRAQERGRAEADLSALTSLAEATADEESLLRGIARTPAGREGRLAVHLGGATIGSSRLSASAREVPERAPRTAEVGVDGGTVLVRRADGVAGPVVVEVFLPAAAPAADGWLWAVPLVGAGALGTGVGVLLARRRVRPVTADLVALADAARGVGGDRRPLRGRTMHTPQTLDAAAAIDGLADRFADAHAGERRLAADLSHRLRTPLTALRLDVSAIGDSPAADRIRASLDALNAAVDSLIRAPEQARTQQPGPARCDVVAVVRKRMAFWQPLAQHTGRDCEVRTVDQPAVTALTEDDLGAVVDALMSNVFRYTPGGTAVAVSVVRHAGWVTLVVDDAGSGVADPASALGRGVSGSGSTGLGLDIARDAVEATGGTIHVERAALGGARVRLRFGEVGAEHADPDEPRAWRLWGAAGRPERAGAGPADHASPTHVSWPHRVRRAMRATTRWLRPFARGDA